MAITDVTIRTRRWSRREYDRLVELGVLDEDEPIELLDGHLDGAPPTTDRPRPRLGAGAGCLTGRARVPRYESVRRLGPRESIAPLATPRRRVRVASLLP